LGNFPHKKLFSKLAESRVMKNNKVVFGIYRTIPEVEEAVDELVENRIPGASIFVLHSKNADTVEFANRKRTHCPAGTASESNADLPLDGSFWFKNPVGHHHGLLHWLLDPLPLGPYEGALHEALAEMGVPQDWCDYRVVKGKLLISVKCNSWQEFFRATGILAFTKSMDISWSVSRDEYRASRIGTGERSGATAQ
jgi:hypothetical protein